MEEDYVEGVEESLQGGITGESPDSIELKLKRKREHEERVRAAQQLKESKKQATAERVRQLQEQSKLRKAEKQAEKRLKAQTEEELQTQLRMAKEARARLLIEQQERLRQEKEAKKAKALIEANKARLDKRERELREVVIRIPFESLETAIVGAFSKYGQIQSIKVDKFSDSFTISYDSMDAAQRATDAGGVHVLPDSELSLAVKRQKVKAHSCYVNEPVSEVVKADFDAHVEKLKPVLETVGPVDTIELIKSYVVVTFKDMDTAEKAVALTPPLALDDKPLNLAQGLPKRIGK